MTLKHLILASAVAISCLGLGVSAQAAQVTTNDQQAAAASSPPKVILLSTLQYLTRDSTSDIPSKREAEMLAAVRLEISENEMYQSVLKAAGFAPEDVIAISADQSGNPLLFVDDL